MRRDEKSELSLDQPLEQSKMEKLYKDLESYELYEISIELICFVETWGFYQKVEAVQNPLYYYITLSHPISLFC